MKKIDKNCRYAIIKATKKERGKDKCLTNWAFNYIQSATL